MSHPKDDDIELYCLGRLSVGESARFDSHIFACPICQVRVLLEEILLRPSTQPSELCSVP